MDIKTFVFIDLETTGLPKFENNKTKITELCCISVQTEHILLGAVPRVQNKISLCFNPSKLVQHEAENITGLSNQLLENQSVFDTTTVNVLSNFLQRLQKPVCFVAHNGNYFDYPILQTHLSKTKQKFIPNIFCIDSLVCFKELLSNSNETVASSSTEEQNCELSDEWDHALIDEVIRIEQDFEKNDSSDVSVTDWQKLNETTPKKNVKPENANGVKHKTKPICDKSKQRGKIGARKRLDFGDNKQSFKLTSIYERLLHREPMTAHHAEADVQMMLECSVILGDRFVKWANSHAVLFSQVPEMRPGRSIRF